MRYAVSSVLLAALLAAVVPPGATAADCRCTERSSGGPGGGVNCEADQFATCDEKAGECNCTCDSAPRGKTRDDYTALVLSRAFGEQIRPSDLSSSRYAAAVRAFDDIADGKVRLRSPDGHRVVVALPPWLTDVFRRPR
jgi:hypothetical protein